MLMRTVEYLRAVGCEHDTKSEAKEMEAIGKAYEENPMKAYLYS